MTFTQPALLVLLVLPAALAVAYVWRLKRRDRVSLRWTNVDAVEAAAIPTDSWRRHVSAVCILAALVALVVAVAQPARVSKVKVYNTRVIVAMDTSISMGATDVAPDRYTAAVEAVDRFATTAGADVEIGLVTFDGTAVSRVAPTYDRPRVVQALDGIPLGEGTSIGDAVLLATRMLQAAQGPTSGTGTERPSPGAVIIISDGDSTTGVTDQEAANFARSANVKVATVVYGTKDGKVTYQGETISVPIDETAMTEMAEITGGNHYVASTGAQLDKVFSDLAESTSSQEVPVEITGQFTMAALVLLCAAALAALLTGPRLP